MNVLENALVFVNILCVNKNNYKITAILIQLQIYSLIKNHIYNINLRVAYKGPSINSI